MKNFYSPLVFSATMIHFREFTSYDFLLQKNQPPIISFVLVAIANLKFIHVVTAAEPGNGLSTLVNLITSLLQQWE